MTYYNNMSNIVKEIATRNGHEINCRRASNGNTCLFDNSEKENVIQAIDAGNWDVVVLQESVSRVNTEKFPEGVKILDEKIKEKSPDVKYIFYEALYKRPFYISEDSILPSVTNRIMNVAKDYKASVAPMGEAFYDLLENYGKDYYCVKDDLHPLPQASFLAALCIYYSLFPDEEEIIWTASDEKFLSDLLVFNTKDVDTDIEKLPENYELEELILINHKAYEHVVKVRNHMANENELEPYISIAEKR